MQLIVLVDQTSCTLGRGSRQRPVSCGRTPPNSTLSPPGETKESPRKVTLVNLSHRTAIMWFMAPPRALHGSPWAQIKCPSLVVVPLSPRWDDLFLTINTIPHHQPESNHLIKLEKPCSLYFQSHYMIFLFFFFFFKPYWDGGCIPWNVSKTNFQTNFQTVAMSLSWDICQAHCCSGLLSRDSQSHIHAGETAGESQHQHRSDSGR